MAFRSIIIESQARVSIKNEQLVIGTECEHSVPMEDISAVLIESRQSTITTAALSALGQCGCAVYFCDEKHMPCAMLMPFEQHSRALSVMQHQLSMTEPTKKRLWQSIVKAKIRNQASCLHFAGLEDGADRLNSLSDHVLSGDTGNVEASAAQFYFPELFGCGFSRGDENGINAALNYGYAILRGCIARYLALYGFIPALGLHHRSALNAFNLADDLIEPFRPVIDLLVFESVNSEDELVPEIKRMLFNCLNLDILSGGRHLTVSYAIEKMVQSISRAAEDKKSSLQLPELLKTAQHCYE